MSFPQRRRLRLLHFVVQPVFVWDDGDSITPGPPAQPNQLTLSALADLADTWADQFAAMCAQVDEGESTGGGVADTE